jgi:hypothetical protein
MNRFAVLACGFEHLSYYLGRTDSIHGHTFSQQKGEYALYKAESEEHAKMVVGASDFLSQHCMDLVGYVQNGQGEVFVVAVAGKAPDASSMDGKQRLGFSIAVMRRLALLHSQGFGCGGLSPSSVAYIGNSAKIANPCSIFALQEGDSVFYEAVSTLRALAGAGFAKKETLPCLASEYLSVSPVCRHEVAKHLSKLNVNRHKHAKALAAHAANLLRYF